MNSKKMFFVMSGLLGLLFVLAIATTFLGTKLLKQKATRLTELKLESRTLEDQQTALTRAKKDIEKYAELNIVAKTIVPQDKDQVKTVREIVKIAADSKISLRNISFPTSSLGQAAPKPVAVADSDDPAAKPAAKTTAPPQTQLKVAEGLNGVYVMEITVQSLTDNVTFDKLISFLEQLENNRRTAHVTSLTISPNVSDRSKLTFTAILNVYIKP